MDELPAPLDPPELEPALPEPAELLLPAVAGCLPSDLFSDDLDFSDDVDPEPESPEVSPPADSVLPLAVLPVFFSDRLSVR